MRSTLQARRKVSTDRAGSRPFMPSNSASCVLMTSYIVLMSLSNMVPRGCSVGHLSLTEVWICLLKMFRAIQLLGPFLGRFDDIPRVTAKLPRREALQLPFSKAVKRSQIGKRIIATKLFHPTCVIGSCLIGQTTAVKPLFRGGVATERGC